MDLNYSQLSQQEDLDPEEFAGKFLSYGTIRIGESLIRVPNGCRDSVYESNQASFSPRVVFEIDNTSKPSKPNRASSPENTEDSKQDSDEAKFSRMKSYSKKKKAKLLKHPQSSVLFSSNFESGNLQKVVQTGQNEYVLLLNPDTETINKTQWFYFSAKCSEQACVRFHIINITKEDCLFTQGMKPLVYSTKKKEGWTCETQEVVFKETTEFLEFLPPEFSGVTNYTLSFTYEFLDDKVYFAYSYPYTFSKLTSFLNSVTKKHSKIARVEPLTETLAGNTCHILTITNSLKSYPGAPKHSEKQGIFITARVHAGETPASFMLEGFVRFVLSNSKLAKELRKQYVFKVIPMLNPDGVRYGNCRCSLLGIDLNRRWIEPSKRMHPTIYRAKEELESFQTSHNVVMFCDMHAHSKKRNIFMYGCAYKPKMTKQKYIPMVIPFLVHKRNSNFSFKDSTFKCEKSKESTGRIVVFKKYSIINSYTLEASFFAAENNTERLSIKDYEKLGEDLAVTCKTFNSKNCISNTIARIAKTFKKKTIKKSKTKKEKSKSTDNLLRNSIPQPIPKNLLTLREEIKSIDPSENRHLKKRSLSRNSSTSPPKMHSKLHETLRTNSKTFSSAENVHKQNPSQVFPKINLDLKFKKEAKIQPEEPQLPAVTKSAKSRPSTRKQGRKQRKKPTFIAACDIMKNLIDEIIQGKSGKIENFLVGDSK